MKTKLLFNIFIFSVFSIGVFAQGVTNDGAVITITSGTHFVIENGNYLNQTNSTDGRIDLDGTLYVDGNFTNNASNNVFIGATNDDGTVVFNGTFNQNISNTIANAFIDFENVTIDKASNTVFLDAGSAATVNGVLNVNAGGTFRLSSPTDGEGPSGSLITNTGAASNVTGAGNLYVDRHFETNNRYQYISMPVNNATDDLFDNTGNSHPFNANLYTYDETVEGGDPPSASYIHWTDYTNYTFYTAWDQVAVDGGAAVPLSGNGIGYITYNELELDINFGGTPANLNNAASYSPAVSYTNNDGDGGAGDYFDGWNVIGNPYPCALDFHALNLTNVNNTVYYWDGDNENYKYYNNGGGQLDDGSNVVSGGTRYIPAMQAFSIKTNSGGIPLISIDAADRVHNTQIMWKGGDKKEVTTQFIRLNTEANGFSDETVIRFFNEANLDFDNQYDAFKMFPTNQDVPMIYSLSTETIEYPLALNSLPLESIGTTIPLGFKTGEDGTFTISVSEFNFDAGTDVKLIDTELETETLLEEGTEYIFDFAGGESRERFYLFSGTQGSDIEDEPINNNIATGVNVWSGNNNVYISISSYDLIDAHIMIFDMLGRTIIDQKLNGAYNIVNVPGSSGTYFVKLRTKDGQVRTDKVFIEK